MQYALGSGTAVDVSVLWVLANDVDAACLGKQPHINNTNTYNTVKPLPNTMLERH